MVSSRLAELSEVETPRLQGSAGQPAIQTAAQPIIDGLAEKSAVSPIITRGSLNEVLEHKLVYDAGTTTGGSGGPVFGPDGRVIGVNFAIVVGFAGSNFGVPVRYLRELLQ